MSSTDTAPFTCCSPLFLAEAAHHNWILLAAASLTRMWYSQKLTSVSKSACCLTVPHKVQPCPGPFLEVGSTNGPSPPQAA
eukprot:12892749-Prorocentrum_lima.AAC.1